MKKFLISALLMLIGSVLFTSCSSTKTTVPQENATTTSRTYSK